MLKNVKFCLISVKKGVPTRFHTTPNLMIYCLIIITFAIYFNSNVQFPNQFCGILLLLSTGDNYLLVPGSAPSVPNRAHHTKHVYGERKKKPDKYPAGMCLFKANNGITKTKWKICFELPIETLPESLLLTLNTHSSCVSFVDFE